jgi:hypothetical protein
MTETITLEELGKRVLDSEVVDALPHIALDVRDPVPQVVTLDELARKTLEPATSQAFPELDLEIEQADILIEVQQARAKASVRGLSLTVLVVLALSTLVCNGALWIIALLVQQ